MCLIKQDDSESEQALTSSPSSRTKKYFLRQKKLLLQSVCCEISLKVQLTEGGNDSLDTA